MFRRALQWLRHPFAAPRRSLTVLALLAVIALGLALTGRQLWAAHHYRAARRALERYRLVEARTHLDRCAAVWSGDFDVQLLAAQTARRLGDYESAEWHLARCQAIRGGVPEVVVIEQSLIRAQRGGMDFVMPYLRSLVEAHHPATPLILESMVQGYLKSYRFGDAAYLLHLWRERFPDDLQANFLQGLVRERVGPEQEAVDNYRRVLELEPEHYEARHQLAALLIDRAQPAEAMTHLEVLSQRRPADLHLRVRLAQCQMALGRLSEAQENLERVLAEKPLFRSGLVARGELALQHDQAAAAEHWLRQALEQDTADFQTNFALARSLRQQSKHVEAEAVEKRLKVMEVDIKRLRNIVKDDINRAPDDPALRTEIGIILLRAGSKREGVQWLYSALRRDPFQTAAHRALIDHFEAVGQPEQAAPHRRFLEGGAREQQPEQPQPEQSQPQQPQPKR